MTRFSGDGEEPGGGKGLTPAQEKERAEAAKAAAAADAAKTSAEKSKRELEEWESSSARARREAESQKAAAEATKATAEARQGQLTAMLPDLSKVERGSLDVKGDQVLFGSELSQRALAAAMTSVAEKVRQVLGGGTDLRILVTGDASLASSDAVYWDVVTGLEQLIAAADEVLSKPDDETGRADFAGPPAAVAAAAAALPSVLSLLSAHRTVNGAAATVEGIAATAAAAGALKAIDLPVTVLHDDVRLLPDGVIRARLSQLDKLRRALAGHKATIEKGKQEEQDPSQPFDDGDSSSSASRLAQVETILAAIESFTGSLRVIPTGGTRSPLATAMLREQLHPVPKDASGKSSGFTHALFVQAAPGSTQQVVSDRPLWWKDKFSAVGVISVSYILIEVGHSEVLAAGSAGGKATVEGSIGSSLSVKTEGLADPRPIS